ncbi:MAG: hypothetical protein JETT_3363 [Candidatus Jettenia ecosi]|uniref:Uncharacterized protein n=1 Tax=Candidatus Jettenia ecosi TaxID=2494326 RepID=A0A533Q867_9BACT|nr:MAG: hypothetical protein JETT_3363 [Candidatus Jettenia ecosi]
MLHKQKPDPKVPQKKQESLKLSMASPEFPNVFIGNPA